MSDKQNPRCPQAKPPCREENDRGTGSVSRAKFIEEMRRQLQEELENSERLLSAANNLMLGAGRASGSACQKVTRTEGNPPPGASLQCQNMKSSASICRQHTSWAEGTGGRARGPSPELRPGSASKAELLSRRGHNFASGHGRGGHEGGQAPSGGQPLAGGQVPPGGSQNSVPGGHGLHHNHHHHHAAGTDDVFKRDPKATEALARLSQLKKNSSYLLCGIDQSLDFLNTCRPKDKRKLPTKPAMEQEHLDHLIRCEEQDVESARYLAMDVRQAYKKPCPKQQKAQMSVMALVKGHASQTCGVEKYSPLDHPEPDEISPDVAASMMFSQEEGIKMDGCPRDTILHLFPDEPRQASPERVGRSSISVVDQSQRNRDELMEKSASVPSEGVSDSAYTRKMKGKGEDVTSQVFNDVDFATGQSKREYVLVAQKPSRFSKVHVRGGNLPSWFPGYFSAFPDEDGGIKPMSSLSELFHKAWLHTNPRNMSASDMIVID